ncbi:hypothetical protein K2173_004166 [Erythroxylum novogranatense]|uniref:Protein ENHANCED DISEASE RESISTANCE 2-like n=1 Tax=Erythroxylum novogranatense TaxID=1862640 RepID=A0AAV8SYN5_9ROSI|nr:hypothetical protein K2173_004166 [Erythroxylum novogranatense]
MDGWLYIIRSRSFGLQFSRKRYYVLQENCLKCFKTVPSSQSQEPLRMAILDSCIRVTDSGRETINRKVFFIFTLYSTLNHNDRLKLGASSSEDAAKWIHSLQKAVLKENPNPAKDFLAFQRRESPPLRFSKSKSIDDKRSINYSSTFYNDAMASDVIEPSPWKIFGCRNGLRLFKEAKDPDTFGSRWDDHPAVMAVGIIDGTSEEVFRTLMSLGPSRLEWDFCFRGGSVVERLDGHTDIIHLQLCGEWLNWGMRRRDLLVGRYWRREDDGTYGNIGKTLQLSLTGIQLKDLILLAVILYHSVIHKRCPPQKGYVRASLKSGGYVVTPVNQGKNSLVKHMLAVDWKYWKLYLRPSSGCLKTIQMLEKLAALREMFKAKSGKFSSEVSSGESEHSLLQPPLTEKDDAKPEVTEQGKIDASSPKNEAEKTNSARSSLISLTEDSDEFFDVPDAVETDFDNFENCWSSDVSLELSAQNSLQPRLTSAASFVKKLHDLAVQKKGYVELQDLTKEEGILCCFGATLRHDPTGTLPCSWSAADPSTYLIRGETYLKDHRKVKAKGTLTQMVGADWLKSDQKQVDLCSRPNSIVQKYAAQGRPEFFFVVNLQIPGSPMHTLAMYFMLNSPIEEVPLLQKFVNGDDAFRNSRFKLIPFVAKGSWIVKQSVGKKACLIAQPLEVNYFHGKNYLELEIDVGSSQVTRGVSNLVFGYLNNLIVELAFVVQANTEEELPEVLFGACRLSHLDMSKAVPV